MILRTSNPFVRAVCAITRSLPYAVRSRLPLYIYHVRVGNDCTNFVRVSFTFTV
jgi:hypothetical protein